jgi:hypothetical protein
MDDTYTIEELFESSLLSDTQSDSPLWMTCEETVITEDDHTTLSCNCELLHQ